MSGRVILQTKNEARKSKADAGNMDPSSVIIRAEETETREYVMPHSAQLEVQVGQHVKGGKDVLLRRA